MSHKEHRLHDGRRGAALAVRVLPRARRNEIAEVMADGTLKIRLTAAPVDGEANRQLVRVLAEALKIPSSRIEIVAGATGRHKIVSILGLDPATLQSRIAALLK